MNEMSNSVILKIAWGRMTGGDDSIRHMHFAGYAWTKQKELNPSVNIRAGIAMLGHIGVGEVGYVQGSFCESIPSIPG